MTPGNRDDNVADPQIGGTEAAALMPGRSYPEIIDLHSQQQNPDTIEEIGFNCDCMSQRESLTVSSGQNPRRNFDGRCAQRVKTVQRPASPAPQASGPMTHQPLRKARHHALFLFHHHRGNFPRSFVWRGPLRGGSRRRGSPKQTCRWRPTTWPFHHTHHWLTTCT